MENTALRLPTPADSALFASPGGAPENIGWVGVTNGDSENEMWGVGHSSNDLVSSEDEARFGCCARSVLSPRTCGCHSFETVHSPRRVWLPSTPPFQIVLWLLAML